MIVISSINISTDVASLGSDAVSDDEDDDKKSTTSTSNHPDNTSTTPSSGKKKKKKKNRVIFQLSQSADRLLTLDFSSSPCRMIWPILSDLLSIGQSESGI